MLFIYLMSLALLRSDQHEIQRIIKNNMEVSWYYSDQRIFFEMHAPTDGWVTIGFNTSLGMSGAYLLMGKVVNGEATVVEHYTRSPGDYRKLTAFGANSAVDHITGEEGENATTLSFSLPIAAQNKYARDLKPGMEYEMTLAFSREDDFQHHSMMRTAIHVKL